MIGPLKILEMIENVAPDNTDALDEIDARVWCYNSNYYFIDNGNDTWSHSIYETSVPVHATPYGEIPHPFTVQRYTRSRDALKMIRPKECKFTLLPIEDGYRFLIRSLTLDIDSADLPTEELAELHAIVQAIKWERDHVE